VPSSPDLCRKWAEAMVTAQAVGRRVESADAWTAATALLHGAPLLTDNRNDCLGVTAASTRQPVFRRYGCAKRASRTLAIRQPPDPRLRKVSRHQAGNDRPRAASRVPSPRQFLPLFTQL